LDPREIAAAAFKWIEAMEAPWRLCGDVETGPRILAIVKDYEAAIHAAYERHGGSALLQRCDDLAGEDLDIMEELIRTPARTFAGWLVKLRVADHSYRWSAKSEEEDDFVDFFMGEALRDAERLAGLAHEGHQGGQQS
jgi:hypothetical protein